GFPGGVFVPSLGAWRTFNNPTNNPTTTDAVPGYNFYNFQETSGLFAGWERLSFYTQARYDFTDNLYGFVEVSFTRMMSDVAAAETLATPTENGLVEGTRLTIPEYNAFNPWGEDINTLRRRMVEAGPRINDVTSDAPRAVAGLGGEFEFFNASQWNWEAYVLHSENTVTNISRNNI